MPDATVHCDTTSGPFEFHLYRRWSPNGVDRAIELFEQHFYDNSHFFRVVHGFLVQFGLSYTTDRALHQLGDSTIRDDPQLVPPIKFEEGIISYAGGGPNSRNSQLFIAYGPVPSLGRELWETPIGKVVKGMENVRKFYDGYGDMPPWGKGPVQQKIRNRGASYMEEEFPLMDRFLECKIEKKDDKKEEYPQHIRSREDNAVVKEKIITNIRSKVEPVKDLKDVKDMKSDGKDYVSFMKLIFLVLLVFWGLKAGLRRLRRNKVSKSN